MATKVATKKLVEEAVTAAQQPQDDDLKDWFQQPSPYDSPVRLRRGQRFTKAAVIRALKASQGLVSVAARKMNCTPKTIRNYMDRYPEIEKELMEIRDSYVDFAEASLLKQIQEKNTTATIFLLKCLGKKRGWVENPNVQLHAHLEAGAGTWSDIMKRVATASGGAIVPTPEEVARVIDVTPKVLSAAKSEIDVSVNQESNASACVEMETEDADADV